MSAAALVIWRITLSLVSVPLLEHARVVGCNARFAVNVGVEESLLFEPVLVAVGDVLEDSYGVSDRCLSVEVSVAFDTIGEEVHHAVRRAIQVSQGQLQMNSENREPSILDC